MNSIDVIQLCLLFAVAMSVIYLAVVQCCAKTITRGIVFFALIILLALAICLFIYPTEHPAKMPIGIIIAALFLLLICSYIEHRREIDMFGIFMEHSTKVLRDDRCCVFTYILLFWVCTFGFLILLIWEFKCYWGGGKITFDKEKSVFWEFEGAGSTILTALLGIQAYWGLSFLKEACKLYIIQPTIVFQEMLFLTISSKIGDVLILSKPSPANILAVSSLLPS